MTANIQCNCYINVHFSRFSNDTISTFCIMIGFSVF